MIDTVALAHRRDDVTGHLGSGAGERNRLALSPLPRASLRERVYEIVLRAIVTGDLEPGNQIRDVDLAESLGVSRTPVREALQRLVDEGLVETVPGAATRVTPIDAGAVGNILSDPRRVARAGGAPRRTADRPRADRRTGERKRGVRGGRRRDAHRRGPGRRRSLPQRDPRRRPFAEAARAMDQNWGNIRALLDRPPRP